jgi:hypothetical protein
MPRVKHAGAAALDRLEPLLAAVRRARPDLRERSRGVFYAGGVATLHFHEDPAGLFADVKVAGAAGRPAWRRIEVTQDAGRARLLRAVSRPSSRSRR